MNLVWIILGALVFGGLMSVLNVALGISLHGHYPSTFREVYQDWWTTNRKRWMGLVVLNFTTGLLLSWVAVGVITW